MGLRSALREHEKTGKLTVLLPFARRKFAYANEDLREIQLRQLLGGPCEVVTFQKTTPQGMRRDAAGVVVVSSAESWEALLG